MQDSSDRDENNDYDDENEDKDDLQLELNLVTSENLSPNKKPISALKAYEKDG